MKTYTLTSDELLDLIRQELDRRDVERQNLCVHAQSATLYADSLRCDQCGKILTPDEDGTWNIGRLPFGRLEQSHMDNIKTMTKEV